MNNIILEYVVTKTVGYFLTHIVHAHPVGTAFLCTCTCIGLVYLPEETIGVVVADWMNRYRWQVCV